MRASITRLGTCLKELEAPKPDTPTHARQLLEKLKSLDKEFRGLHYEVIDDGSEDTVEAEQVVLEKHDDDVACTHCSSGISLCRRGQLHSRRT